MCPGKIAIFFRSKKCVKRVRAVPVCVVKFYGWFWWLSCVKYLVMCFFDNNFQYFCVISTTTPPCRALFALWENQNFHKIILHGSTSICRSDTFGLFPPYVCICAIAIFCYTTPGLFRAAFLHTHTSVRFAFRNVMSIKLVLVILIYGFMVI